MPLALLMGCLVLMAIALRDLQRLPVAHLRLPLVGAIALAPEVATRDMLGNRGRIDPFEVQRSQPWPGGRLVVYHYTVTPANEPARTEFGFALVELRRGGWSVFDGSMHASLPLPASVSFASVERNGTLIVYGHVVDPEATRIQVRTNTGRIAHELITHKGFTVLVPGAQSIVGLRTLDQAGNVRYETDQPAQFAPDQ